MNAINQVFDRARPPRQWMLRYTQLKKFTREHGQLPTRSQSSGSLVSWVKNQRRSWTLTREQVRLLEQLPGWSWDPREDAWLRRAEEVRTFLQQHGRLPRARATHVRERSLAHWYSRQLRASQKGELSTEREVTLRQIGGASAGG
ncbi:helicase associated domain-containing protein [Microbacterium sp. CFBP 8790]|uniref:helicase associated domain-containing protein n=2 Tax=unclassified Microbacterium TaxID=2609290 RepID=UPI003F885078